VDKTHRQVVSRFKYKRKSNKAFLHILKLLPSPSLASTRDTCNIYQINLWKEDDFNDAVIFIITGKFLLCTSTER